MCVCVYTNIALANRKIETFFSIRQAHTTIRVEAISFPNFPFALISVSNRYTHKQTTYLQLPQKHDRESICETGNDYVHQQH